jgi:hypothetical protein
MTLYHMDQHHQLLTNNNSTTTVRELGELTVWAELLVLVQSGCLVTSTSGFSQLAAWLQRSSKSCAIHFDDCQSMATVKQVLGGVEFSCENKNQ